MLSLRGSPDQRRRSGRRAADRRGRGHRGRGAGRGDAPPGGPTGSIWGAGTAPPSAAPIATNAGGLQVLRYGATRAQLLGMEAVLGTGAVVSHLGGLTEGQHRLRPGGAALRQRGHARAWSRRPGCAWSPPSPERVVALLAFRLHRRPRSTPAFLLRREPARSAVARALPRGRPRAGLPVTGAAAARSPTPIPAYLLAEVAGPA